MRSEPIFTIVRQEYHQEGTPGFFYLAQQALPLCATLERPRLANQKDNPKTSANESSCIPEGMYNVTWSFSSKFRRFMFVIEEVPNRSGIRFHNANNIEQLFGCIAPCNNIRRKVKSAGVTYEFWADYGNYNGRARDFISQVFEKSLPKKFRLKITSIETEKACNV